MAKKDTDDKKAKDVNKIIITSLEELLKNSEEYQEEKPKRRRISTRKRGSNKSIKNPEEEYYDEDEKKFYDKLTDDEKRFVASLEIKIKDMNKDDTPVRFKVLMSNVDEKIKAIAIKKLNYLCWMTNVGPEYVKTIGWIESLCRLPIGKYKPLPVQKDSPLEDIRNFIKSTKAILDETVYGHKDAKDQIIRLLAQKISNPNSCGNVIGICSPPGCGKTLLAKHGISKALDLPFGFVSLGGLEDSSHFVGHNYTYEGSSHGKIAELLMKSEYMNPVIFFDELDKVSQTFKGDEIINLLIHMTDATQNDKFEDKYFTDVDMDLSQCILIFSYNNEELISPILRDRMIRIKIDGYKLEDKLVISQKYLLRDLCKQFGFQPNSIGIEEDALRYLINTKIEEEQGVRNLRRALENIMSNINLNLITEEEKIMFPFTITEEVINRYIKLPEDSQKSKLHMLYT